MHCVFCDRLKRADLLAENDLAAAFADAFPLTPGHTLVVPRRHESDFLALSENEHAAIWTIVSAVRVVLDRGYRPDGYNLGVNVGHPLGRRSITPTCI